MMKLRRNRGDDSQNERQPAPISLSKFKRRSGRSLAKKHQCLQYVLIFFIGCIMFAYYLVLSHLNDPDNSDGERTAGRKSNVQIRATAKQKSIMSDDDYLENVRDWRVGTYKGGITPEGQKRLSMQQRYVPKDLKDLTLKLQRLKKKYPVAEKGKRTDRNVFKPFNKKNRVQLDRKFDKKGNLVYEPITSVKKEDLLGMGYTQDFIDKLTKKNATYDEAIKGRERLVNILHEAAIDDIAPEVITVLPKWSSVRQLYGDKPVVLGLERCEEFRSQTDPIDASLGIAGMFNTGTNPMAMYISNNLKMPRNKKDKAGGTRWQVPWGKHRLGSQRLTNTASRELKTNKTNVLPIVLVRDPYSWMQSMCRHKYEARWAHSAGNCPHLAEQKLNKNGTAVKVPMIVKYNPTLYFDSLADYWGQWYKEYLEADYPRLIVRFEDIQFHARELVEIIAQCAGAVPREPDALFRYVVDSAKWGSAHQSKSNMISTMVKYGTDENRFNGMTEADWLVAEEVFTPEIMDLFGYQMPKKLREKARKDKEN